MDDLTIIKLITIAYVVVVAILAYKIRSLRYRIDENQYDSNEQSLEIAETARKCDNELAQRIKTQNGIVGDMFNRYNRLLDYLKLEDVIIAEEKVVRKLKKGKN